MMAVGFDARKFRGQLDAIQRDLPDIIRQMTLHGTEIVYRCMVKNLEGPYYGPGGRGSQTGRSPIPRLTIKLRQSGNKKIVAPNIGVVYSDKRVAPYNEAVHNGTRRMQPRRFCADAFVTSKAQVIKEWILLFRAFLTRHGA